MTIGQRPYSTHHGNNEEHARVTGHNGQSAIAHLLAPPRRREHRE
ncbi:hypothetical protein AB0D46_11515 [Streptomyces sp. NPDC048383]